MFDTKRLRELRVWLNRYTLQLLRHRLGLSDVIPPLGLIAVIQ